MRRGRAPSASRRSRRRRPRAAGTRGRRQGARASRGRPPAQRGAAVARPAVRARGSPRARVPARGPADRAVPASAPAMPRARTRAGRSHRRHATPQRYATPSERTTPRPRHQPASPVTPMPAASKQPLTSASPSQIARHRRTRATSSAGYAPAAAPRDDHTADRGHRARVGAPGDDPLGVGPASSSGAGTTSAARATETPDAPAGRDTRSPTTVAYVSPGRMIFFTRIEQVAAGGTPGPGRRRCARRASSPSSSAGRQATRQTRYGATATTTITETAARRSTVSVGQRERDRMTTAATTRMPARSAASPAAPGCDGTPSMD